ncbi:unnamed protein product [Prorocentrum cordatum]|uniref:Uncharacterized protein n=1 Tax=Prorocentrum cordatum TaxID=2364126 RepID=A0ABN9PD49_9DINO|nr:unnamed protein product [Polarella glacialis]
MPAANDNCHLAAYDLKAQMPAGIQILKEPVGDNTLDSGDGGYGLYSDANFRKGEAVQKYISLPWPRDRGTPRRSQIMWTCTFSGRACLLRALPCLSRPRSTAGCAPTGPYCVMPSTLCVTVHVRPICTTTYSARRGGST